MLSSLIIAGYLTFFHDQMGFLPLEPWMKTMLGAGLTTFVWVVATFITPPTSEEKLVSFYRLIKPGGPGWKAVVDKAQASGAPIDDPDRKFEVPLEIFAMIIGCITIYGTLFATGYWIYGKTTSAIILTIISIAGTYLLFKLWGKLKTEH